MKRLGRAMRAHIARLHPEDLRRAALISVIVTAGAEL